MQTAGYQRKLVARRFYKQKNVAGRGRKRSGPAASWFDPEPPFYLEACHLSFGFPFWGKPHAYRKVSNCSSKFAIYC